MLLRTAIVFIVTALAACSTGGGEGEPDTYTDVVGWDIIAPIDSIDAADTPADTSADSQQDTVLDIPPDTLPDTPPDTPQTGCLTDDDCEGETPACLLETGECVVCADHGHCLAPTPLCDPGTNTCVGCLEDEDCPQAAPWCEPGGHECVLCVNNASCASPTPICSSETWECVGCASFSDCLGSPDGNMCDLETGACVSCLSNNDCLAPTPYCGAGGTCISCTDDPEVCQPGAPACDLVSGQCVECLIDGDCVGDLGYCSLDQSCVACTQDAHCDDPTTPFCIVTTGVCGECVEDAQCSDPLLQWCDPATGTCVECAAPFQCVYPAHLCDPATQTCVQCTGPLDCPMTKPICMAGTAFCVECLLDGDCPAEKPFCDALNHACFECQSDADCGGDQPYCASAFGKCQACMNVSDCDPGQKCFFSVCKDLASGPDSDNDTVENSQDNCPDNSNWNQADLDGDGLGDACDSDIDGDGWEDIEDNCPAIANADQFDQDENGWGDACEDGGGAASERVCGTLGYPAAVQFFEGFEKGMFLGWFIPDGTAGSWTPGYTMNYVAPAVTTGAAHSGQYGVHFPNVTWPNEANHNMELELCMPLTTEVTLSAWVKPVNVGYCCGQYGTAALKVSFLKGTQGYTLSFLWSYSSQVDSTKHHLFRMDDAPFNWTEGTWNHLEIDLQQALTDAFNFADLSNVLIVKIVAYNHYSNGSPQGFDIDDIELIPVP